MEEQTIITEKDRAVEGSTVTEAVSPNSEPKGGRRIRHGRQNPSEALSILQSAAFRAEKHGVSFALMNLPGQKALGLVIANAWHCGKCLNFFWGEMPKSQTCKDCEAK